MGPAKRKPTLKSPGAPRSEKANRGDTMAEGVCLSHLGYRSLLPSPEVSTRYAGFKADIRRLYNGLAKDEG
jgi:hypothetical protein